MKYIDVKDLIPGKWYYTAVVGWYFLFNYIEPMDGYTRVYFTSTVKSGVFSDRNNWFSNNEMAATIEEVTDFSLIQKFLPAIYLEIY